MVYGVEAKRDGVEFRRGGAFCVGAHWLMTPGVGEIQCLEAVGHPHQELKRFSESQYAYHIWRARSR
jgi:hypothetical protein